MEQWTVRDLVAALSELPANQRVQGFGVPYARGADLVFPPFAYSQPAGALLATCQRVAAGRWMRPVGAWLPRRMSADALVWLGAKGEVTDHLVGLDMQPSRPVTPITEGIA